MKKIVDFACLKIFQVHLIFIYFSLGQNAPSYKGSLDMKLIGFWIVRLKQSLYKQLILIEPWNVFQMLNQRCQQKNYQHNQSSK